MIGLVANPRVIFPLKKQQTTPHTVSPRALKSVITQYHFLCKKTFPVLVYINLLFFPGINRYLDCIEIMYGFRIFVVWKWMFLVVAPITVTVVFVLNCISYRYVNINKLLLVSSTQFALVIWPIHNFLYRQLLYKTVLSRLGRKYHRTDY